jgi:hypothetical protein
VFGAVVAAYVGIRNTQRQADAAEQQARLAAESAAKSAESALKRAASDRFGPWQLRKREVYATFLAAAQPLRVPDIATEEDRNKCAVEGATLLLYAYADAREMVQRVLRQPELLADTKKWDELIEVLRKDIHIRGTPT